MVPKRSVILVSCNRRDTFYIVLSLHFSVIVLNDLHGNCVMSLQTGHLTTEKARIFFYWVVCAKKWLLGVDIPHRKETKRKTSRTNVADLLINQRTDRQSPNHPLSYIFHIFMLYHVPYHSISCCDDTEAVLRLGVQDKFLPLCGTIKLTFTDVQSAVIKIILKLCKIAGQLGRYCSNSSIHLANLCKKAFSKSFDSITSQPF